MKKCIFNSKKECTNCGQCDICDLNPEKKCDNCGICLQLQGYDTKAIGITEVNKGSDSASKNFEEVVKETVSIEANILEENLNPSEDIEDLEEDIEIDSSEKEIDAEEEKNTQEALRKELEKISWEDYDPNEGFEPDPNVVYYDDIDGLSEIMNDPDMKGKIMNENYPGLLKFKEK